MNIITKLGAVSAITLLALQPAMAQDASSAMSDATSAMSEATSVLPSAESTAESVVGGTYDGLLASLSAGATADLTAITDATTVNFVLVSSVSAGADVTALDTALDTNATALGTLRTDMGANAALSAKLTAAGYTPDQVVGVVTEADGSVTVYIDDRA